MNIPSMVKDTCRLSVRRVDCLTVRLCPLPRQTGHGTTCADSAVRVQTHSFLYLSTSSLVLLNVCWSQVRFMTPGFEKNMFPAASGDQRVLARGLSASVLVVPCVDPPWSHVGGECRQLCNYSVSLTH